MTNLKSIFWVSGDEVIDNLYTTKKRRWVSERDWIIYLISSSSSSLYYYCNAIDVNVIVVGESRQKEVSNLSLSKFEKKLIIIKISISIDDQTTNDEIHWKFLSKILCIVQMCFFSMKHPGLKVFLMDIKLLFIIILWHHLL